MKQFLYLTFLSLALLTSTSRAGQVTLNLTTYGVWTQDTSEGNPGSNFGTGNQMVGELSLMGDNQFWVTYYVLNLTTLSLPISSITFQLENTVPSSSGSQYYQLSSTTDSPSVLEASGTSMSVYNALVGGTLFGSVTEPLTTPLNFTIAGDSAFVSFINANLGNVVAIAANNNDVDRIDAGTPSFTVTTVPEPSPSFFLCTALLPFLAIRSLNSIRLAQTPAPGNSHTPPSLAG